MRDHQEGQIITFYSYKGGTGRTMALANTAWILASNGHKVLAIDWDLESPGLHKFFHPFLTAGISDTPGVVEMLQEYAWAAVLDEPRPDDWYEQYAQVHPYVTPLKWNGFPAPGRLDFMSAGRQNREYSSLIASFDWDNFWDQLGGGLFFDALRSSVKRDYDFVLIDSRTGLSDIADICTMHLPDRLVDCFTLSDQGIEGAANVARDVSQASTGRSMQIFPVPMRVEESAEKEKLDAGRAYARSKFDRFLTGPGRAEPDRYWASVEIPYRPFYAFEEILAAFVDVPNTARSMLKAYESLTEVVTGIELSNVPIDEKQRLRYRDLFTRVRPVAPGDVILSYVPEDRIWAEWLQSLLVRADFRVHMHCETLDEPSDARPERGGVDHFIAVLSPAYVRSPRVRELWPGLSAGAGSAGRPVVVPVRVADMRTAYPFSDPPAVDLVRIDEDQATMAVMRALGQSPRDVQSLSATASSGARFPRTQPVISNLPTRNTAFTGRGTLLERLRDQLIGGNNTAAVVPQALHGLGGIGKSQVALEYAHRFTADYDVLWYVPSAQAALAIPALVDLAEHLGIPVGDNVEDVLQSLRRKLQRDTQIRWLLLFDNAHEPADIENLLPGGHGHVIITSRGQEWSQLATPLEVDVFTREESVQHLVQRVGALSREDADMVADALGDLPLAIEQAAAWLSETGMAPGDYVDQLKTKMSQVLSLNKPANYPTPVAAAWEVSFTELQQRSPAGTRLLQLCAFFAPEAISIDMLYSDEARRALVPYDPALREKLVMGRVIKEISRFGLARLDQAIKSVVVHRLVQGMVRHRMSEDEQVTAAREVHAILVRARPWDSDVDDQSKWQEYDKIWPHLDPSKAIEWGREPIRDLLIERVRYLWRRGQFEDAIALGEELEAAWLVRYPLVRGRLTGDPEPAPDDQELETIERQILHLRFQVANVLRSQGLYIEARRTDDEVLTRQRVFFGANAENHPHTLMTAGGLAADLRALGEYADALRMATDTFDRLKENFGDDHPRTLAAANNLAVSLRTVGRFADARDVDEDTYQRRILVLGAQHPYTLFSGANLGGDLRDAGEYTKSVQLLRQMYEQHRTLLGEDYPDTLRTAKSLGVSLRKAGFYSEAFQLTEQTSKLFERVYGVESPDTLVCRINLASDLAALGEKSQARDIVSKVRDAFAGMLGPEHPYTLIAANNLSIYVREAESPEKAAGMAADTFRAMEVMLGDNHPYTLYSAVNYANCLTDLGNLGEALRLERATLQALRDTLGPTHPDTLACSANLAKTLSYADHDSEARSLREETLNSFRAVLGETHQLLEFLEGDRRMTLDLEALPV
ncbi:FxSxx-COOH system tetratricopeptide repeat protein [Sphaerisporangium sp. NPDC005288]|uniref:FxSxx-COOH system tetratricopeptide repeat protein n=1 Tax=Sphaerisporangium sp. NPDC005288 TaxID=3155114 RepID=UPI0033B245BE